MTYQQAVDANRAVEEWDLHKGDMLLVDGYEDRVRLTLLQDFKGKPVIGTPGLDLMPDLPSLFGTTYWPYRGKHFDVTGCKVFPVPFPKNRDAQNWIVRETMGTLYDPEKPRNEGSMPEPEY